MGVGDGQHIHTTNLIDRWRSDILSSMSLQMGGPDPELRHEVSQPKDARLGLKYARMKRRRVCLPCQTGHEKRALGLSLLRLHLLIPSPLQPSTPKTLDELWM